MPNELQDKPQELMLKPAMCHISGTGHAGFARKNKSVHIRLLLVYEDKFIDEMNESRQCRNGYIEKKKDKLKTLSTFN